MHFGFALNSSDINLLNIDLLDTHLDLLDTDISNKQFVCLQDVFSVTIFRLPRRLQDLFKTSCEMSSKRLGKQKVVTLKTCLSPTNIAGIEPSTNDDDVVIVKVCKINKKRKEPSTTKE